MKKIALYSLLCASLAFTSCEIFKVVIVDNQMWTLPKYRELLFIR